MSVTTIQTRRAEIEEDEQIALMTWLRHQYPAVFARTIHVPNGGKRGRRVAGRLKAMGTKPGVPDVLCFVPSREFRGLAIEMKRPGAPPSATTEEQIDWLRYLEAVGWHCCICRGFDEARTAIVGYLA